MNDSKKERWTLHVCPECGSAVTDQYTPSEFIQLCRHAEGVQSADIGRNVARKDVIVAPVSELQRISRERDLALKALGFEDYEQAKSHIGKQLEGNIKA